MMPLGNKMGGSLTAGRRHPVVSGPAAEDIKAVQSGARASAGSVERAQASPQLPASTALSDYITAVATSEVAPAIASKLAAAGLDPAFLTLVDSGRGAGRVSAESADPADLGVMILRKPSLSELEMGFDSRSIVLVPTTATRSPFGGSRPEARTPFGASDHRNVVTTTLPERGGTVLYGDAADVLNRLVSGAGSLLSKARGSLDWDRLTPAAKASIAALGTGAALYGGSRLLGPTGYLRLGMRLGNSDDHDGGRVTGLELSESASSDPYVNAQLQRGSTTVAPMSDALMLASKVTVLPNAFFASAYSLGKVFANRAEQPTFATLVGDPMGAATQLRANRCPRLFLAPGRVIRSSAPYAAAWLQNEARAACQRDLAVSPLAGGVFSELAGEAASAIAAAGKSLLSQVKGWLSGLWSKVRRGFKKLTSPHTVEAAKEFSIRVSPLYLALKLWAGLGKVAEADLAQVEADIDDAHARMMTTPGRRDEVVATVEAAAQDVADLCERIRVAGGIPSAYNWNSDVSVIRGAGGVTGGGPFNVLAQYAPATTENCLDLSNCPSNDLIDIFDTRNPVILFSDANALERDLRDITRTAGAVGSERAATSGSAGPNGGISSAGPRASGTASSGDNSITDPLAFAAHVATTSEMGSGAPSRVPDEWLQEMPSSIQAAYYGAAQEEVDPAFVGDPTISVARVGARARNNAAVFRRGLRVRDALRESADAKSGRVLPGSAPMAGFAAAIVPVAKFLATWILPSILMGLDWSKVGQWVKKNGTKARLLLANCKTKALLAATANKSGGALAAFGRALKTLAGKAGTVAKGLLIFAGRNPKLALLTALISSAWVMDAAKSGDGKVFQSLLDLLTKALSEAAAIDPTNADVWLAHKDAVASMSGDGSSLTQDQAEELQTAVMAATMLAQMVRAGSVDPGREHTALDQLLEAFEKAKESAEIQGDPGDWDSMLEVMDAQLAGALEDGIPSPAPRAASVALDNKGGEAGEQGGLTPSASAALASSLAALGAGGGEYGPATTDPTPADETTTLPEHAGAEDGQRASDLMAALTPAQAEDLAVTASAVAAASKGAQPDEAALTTAAKAFVRQWGLPLAAVGGVAAGIGYLARKKAGRGLAGSADESPSDLVEWWNVVRSQLAANTGDVVVPTVGSTAVTF